MSVRDSWRECRLGDVIELKRGYDLPQQQRRDGVVPIVSSSGPTGFHSESMARAPGVVTGRYGTIGQVFYVEQDFWPLNTTLYVRDFKGNDPKFVSYFLRVVDFYSCSDKAAVPGVNRNDLHQLGVALPPLREQRAIAHVLGALDDKIELNRKMSETLEELARTLFKSWFVDFDPVHAKAAGKKPFGMDDATAALFPDSFEDSELGPIPRGWRVANLGESFELTMGQSPPGSTYNESGEGIPFYQGARDFGWRFVAPRVFCTAPTRYARAGSVLVSVRAPVGRLNVTQTDCAIGRGVAAVRHASGEHQAFALEVLRSCSSTFEKFNGEGTVFGSISKGDFERIRHVAPPAAVITAFSATAEALNRRIEAAHDESRTLAELRDTLLPKLLSGELRVPISVGAADAGRGQLGLFGDG